MCFDIRNTRTNRVEETIADKSSQTLNRVIAWSYEIQSRKVVHKSSHLMLARLCGINVRVSSNTKIIFYPKEQVYVSQLVA